MYRLYRAMADRISELLVARSNLQQNAFAGTNRLILDDVTQFKKEAVNNSFPTILLKDSNATGRRTGSLSPSTYGGSVFQGTELAYIDYIADDNTIILQSPLERDWRVDKNTEVLRAPAGVPIRDVIVGDIVVQKEYPAISIIPVSKNISWRTLSSTMDTIQIDFVVYVRDTDTEKSTETVLQVADALEWVLISNLHIKPIGYDKAYEVTSMAMPKNIQYGTIAKGSEFLKAATITWEADLWFWRGYLTAQGLTDNAFGKLGTLDNFGPLSN